MRKMKLREIREYIASGDAVSVTLYGFDALESLRKAENGFDKVGYSTGVYGISGGIVQGRETGTLYAVVGRTTALFQLF